MKIRIQTDPLALDLAEWLLMMTELQVLLAGLEGEAPALCSRGVRLVPDCSLAGAGPGPWQAVVLPGGGPGAAALAASGEVGEILQAQVNTTAV